jgi:hypothetical protein
MLSRFRHALGLAALVCQACAATPPAAAPSDTRAAEPPAQGATEPPPADTEIAGAAPEAAAPGGGGDDGLDADIAALSASTRPADAPKAEPPKTVPSAPSSTESGGREIVYRVTARGLVIEIDGIHLRPEAKAFKQKSGAYGIELVVNAESFDGRQYWVNKPGEGPLSIAGKVEGKAGKRERFGDQREGNGEEVVMEGTPRRFKQRWPGRGQPKLWPGETVTLEVGLWGVRAESERERPVRRLFEVKMVAGNKSQAVITPPTLDWGS